MNYDMSWNVLFFCVYLLKKIKNSEKCLTIYLSLGFKIVNRQTARSVLMKKRGGKRENG